MQIYLVIYDKINSLHAFKDKPEYLMCSGGWLREHLHSNGCSSVKITTLKTMLNAFGINSRWVES